MMVGKYLSSGNLSLPVRGTRVGAFQIWYPWERLLGFEASDLGGLFG